MVVQYSQCWEDPGTMLQALDIQENDNVLSIGSGGDNSFALLLNNPLSISVIDKNPLQYFLVELKMKAIEILDHKIFLEFIGVHKSSNRIEIYNSIRPGISEDARLFWDSNHDLIDQGIIHIGKFEKYFKLFREKILPLIHNRKSISELFQSSTLEEQEQFYKNHWDNLRWRFLFKVFFSRILLGRLGRHPSYFNHVNAKNISEILMKRAKSGLTDIPVRDNYFLEYILYGNYNFFESSHPYLNSQNFIIIKRRIDKIKLVRAGIEEHLKEVDFKYNKFNLSDIFEYMSDNVFETTMKIITKSSVKEAKIAYWTLFVPRKIPALLRDELHYHHKMSDELFRTSKTFFYESFNLLTVR